MSLFKFLFKPTLLAISIAWLLSPTANASIVRGDIDYQNFRDFAENKGQFGLDATNVEILDKQGQSVGTVLDGVPMMDFAVVSRTNGVATLVEPQYLASVQHNRGYQSVQFGDHSSNNPDNHHYDYQITNRHLTAPGVEINSWHREDYHTPRLHKLVTEVAPIASSDETHLSGFTNKDKYTAFVRAGSGVQMVVDEQGGTPRQVAGAYNHMTGGQMLGSPSVYNHRAIPGTTPDTFLRFDGPSTLFNQPMGSSQRSGDSGSGVFGYDSQAGRWVYVASAQSSTGSNTFVISHLGLVDKNEQLSIAGDIIQSGQTLAWTPNGNSSQISANGQTLLTVGLVDNDLLERDGINNGHWFRPRQDHGKTFTVMGENNIIQLSNDINQGAGAIYFKGDTTVEGLKAGTTWLGAGVSIDKDKTVTWRVHNPTGDRLSKIGEGTLLVQGTGTNAGSISVGDGKVILDQQADSDGNKQAFSEVGIVSGRGTVVLNSNDQVNPDNIYFGFRGGRLDVNGNDLTFNRIQNADSGARIVNHNANQASNVSVKGFTAPKIEDIELIPWERWSPTNSQTHLYEDRRYGYYILRGRWGTFIPGQPHENLSDENWEFVSKDKEEALALFNARRAERIKASGTNYHTGFNGVLGETDETRGTNGELNIAYNPSLTGAKWLLTGGSNLNGTLSAENGTVLMSGRPTPHAYDFIGNKEVIIEGDWQNRNFKATTFEAKTDGKIAIGRNVDTVIGDFKGTGNGEIQAGFTQSKSDACLRSDRTGAVTCDTPTLSDKDLASWERTQIVGRVNLADQSRFTVGSKGHFIGTLFGTDDSTVTLDKDAVWTMTGESGLNRLVVDNATVNLNANFEQGQSNRYNRLNIGELSGQGTFNYLTDIGQLESDRIMVGQASGDFKLNVKNSGAEPTHNERLVLLATEHERDFKVALANPDERVDIGAYRYELARDDQTFYLYSPKIEQEFLAKAEAERQRQEAERLERERQAELARQEAERQAELAKQEAERLERERQAELAKQEAERLERERIEAERQAELARQEAERQAELAKQEAERLERERQAELAKQEAERLERERIEAERQAELARQEAERQAELARQEAERIEAERQAELVRQEAERLERERQAELAKQEAERLERERQQAELARQEAERLERERQAELARQEAERLERERQAELARQEAERLERERQAELARQEAERQAELVRQEAERLERERQAELARQEAERLERERQAELAKQEAERLEAERQAELARQEAERQAELARQEAERQAELAKQEVERQAELAKQEAERIEAERQAELAKQEAERIEAERQAELAKQEAERIEAERQAELAKQEAERLERERLEAERQAELAKQEAERLEAERQAELARQEAERLERERIEAERQAELAKQEAERLEAERQAELARLEAERIEAERQAELAKQEAERLEAERQAELARQTELARQEAERQAEEAARQVELARQEAERLERERIEAEHQAELARQEAERLERERQAELAKQEAERLERERLEAERQAELARQEAERIEAERQAELAKQEAERLERERIEAEKIAREKAEAERLEAERLAREKAEAERLETERIAREKAEAERLEAERIAREKAEAERLEAERLAREKAEKERLARERKQADYISRYTNAALSELAAQANSLNQIHNGITTQILANDAQNIWLHLEHGNGTTQQSDLYRPFEKDDRLMQIGVKHDLDQGNRTLTLGAIYSKHDSEQQFADQISNQADTQMLSLYAKQKWDNHAFVAVDTGFGQAKQQLQSAGETINVQRKVASTGIQVGKTFNTPVIDVQPSVGLRYDHLNGVNYTLNQAKINSDDVGIVSYRAGVKFSKDIQTANGLTIQPSLSSHWNDSINSSTTLHVNGHQFKQDFGSYHQHEIGLGMKYNQWGVDLKGTYAKGDEISQQKSAGLKVSYAW